MAGYQVGKLVGCMVLSYFSQRLTSLWLGGTGVFTCICLGVCMADKNLSKKTPIYYKYPQSFNDPAESIYKRCVII